MTRLLALLAVLGWPLAAAAYCPCYGVSHSPNTYNCALDGTLGINPTATEWHPIFDLVARGPSVWGAAGPTYGSISAGCNNPTPIHQVPTLFPCEILHGIAMQESGWRQFCVTDTPADQVDGNSKTIISFDCGYGIGQVTSGMHIGETPGFDRARVAGDPTYNLATGATILADKWKATHCVGDNQPNLVEDWYVAVWAYNGLAYSNNPSNPTYGSNRGVWDPNVGGAAPYQEHIFGWIEHPPDPSYWPSVTLAYPNPGGVGTSGNPPNIPDPTCASPTDCATTRPVHATVPCGNDAGVASDGGTTTDAGSPTGDGGSLEDAGAPDGGLSASDSGQGADAGRPGTSDAGPGSVSGKSCGCSGADAVAGVWVTALLAAASRRKRHC